VGGLDADGPCGSGRLEQSWNEDGGGTLEGLGTVDPGRSWSAEESMRDEMTDNQLTSTMATTFNIASCSS